MPRHGVPHASRYAPLASLDDPIEYDARGRRRPFWTVQEELAAMGDPHARHALAARQAYLTGRTDSEKG